MQADRDKVLAFREAFRQDRSEREAWMRANWRTVLLEVARDLCGGVLFGACVGLALAVWALTTAVRNY